MMRRNYLEKRFAGNAVHHADGPGSVFEVDATLVDVYLVSDLQQCIGQPVVYTVTDVFSSMLVGVYVGLEGPSWHEAIRAIEN